MFENHLAREDATFFRNFPTVCALHNLVSFGVHALEKNDKKAAAARIIRDVIRPSSKLDFLETIR